MLYNACMDTQHDMGAPSHDVGVEIGKKVAAIRKLRGLSQRQLAQRASREGVNVNHSYISMLEAGKIGSPGTVAMTAIAAALKVSRSELEAPIPEGAAGVGLDELLWGAATLDAPTGASRSQIRETYEGLKAYLALPFDARGPYRRAAVSQAELFHGGRPISEIELDEHGKEGTHDK